MSDLIAETSRNLDQILDLCAALPARATDLGGSLLMPGGDAMVELGPVARADVWLRRQDLDQAAGVRHDHAEDADPDEHWTAYQTVPTFVRLERTGRTHLVRMTITRRERRASDELILEMACGRWFDEADIRAVGFAQAPVCERCARSLNEARR